MVRTLKLILLLTGLAAISAPADDILIPGFPLGVGRSVDASIFEPYLPALQAVADTLKENRNAYAIVSGSADGNRFSAQHDAKNPTLALGRAHALRDLMVTRFEVNPRQLVVQTVEPEGKGDSLRSAGIRVVFEEDPIDIRIASLEQWIEQHINEHPSLVPQPMEPLPPETTIVIERSSSPLADFGVKLGIGASTTPFGSLPVATGGVTWKRIVFVEAQFGHSIWLDGFELRGVTFSTRQRLASAYLAVYPWETIPVGFVGGWKRAETMDWDSFRYLRISEGPMIGVRVEPLHWLSITGTYTPAKQRTATFASSENEFGQLALSISVIQIWGGDR